MARPCPKPGSTARSGDDALLFGACAGARSSGGCPSTASSCCAAASSTPSCPTELLGTQATVQAAAGTDDQFRYINGWVTRFEPAARSAASTSTASSCGPWLWHLTLGADCRIFQNKTALEIIKAVFARVQQRQVDDPKLTGTPRKRPYCVQYRESDFDFVSRLMEEEGICYYFSYTEGAAHPGAVQRPRRPRRAARGVAAWAHRADRGQVREDIVARVAPTQQVRSLQVHAHRLRPRGADGRALRRPTSVGRLPDARRLEVYDYPGGYADPGDGDDADARRRRKRQAAQVDASSRPRRRRRGDVRAAAWPPA